jgi:hypothetical protein
MGSLSIGGRFGNSRWHSVAAEYRGQVSATVEVPQDTNVGADDAVHNHVIAQGKGASAGPELVVACPSKFWMLGQQGEPLGQDVDHAVGHGLAAGFSSEIDSDIV